jgi:hypothetical protein
MLEASQELSTVFVCSEFRLLAYTISKNVIGNDPMARFVVQGPSTKKMWMAGWLTKSTPLIIRGFG